ncbi:hypothetical protein CVS30_03170 [Arthrobacter psychrolactophilus]|uniref:Glycosyl transferase n=1 Tax=Arthrobacter psychrolactophilus TaxID=92442 RepID=A0A2V5IZ12_9MICC|nr:hypothetical protein CVS30_03170 [Arthrobacter psychrolactophilus]
MLGKFLRSKIAIVLAILGLLILGSGIGQRTIWLPPATLTASVPAVSSPAPLTVIGSELLDTSDGKFTMTIKNDGPIQLAVARVDDIMGWIGDAAYTKVGAANADFTALTTQSTAGAATVPNPTGSDMWVSEEKGTGEMSYTWQAPGHGEWALLLSSDGTAAAPTDISVTVDNQAGTPWAIPLMVIGSALLALAALFFLIAPRKSKPAEAGRRSAVRPADPATGALEVAKILAAREGAKSEPSAPAHETIADIRRAASKDTVDGAAAATAAVPTAPVNDATSALPIALPGEIIVPGKKDSETPAEAQDAAPTKDKDKDSDHDANSGSGSGKGKGGTSGKPSRWSAAARKKAAADKEAGSKNDSSEFRATAVARPVHTMKSKARWGAALAAVLLAGSVSPAMADDVVTPSASPDASATPAASATASAASETAGFPNLLDSQVQRIADSVAQAVASGDNSKNAKELESRVSGTALEVRTANYKIRSAVDTQPAVEPVNATPLLAKIVTTTQTWPRSAMFVTKGENNELPQLLTLTQASARENYKLTKATPLLPGQTLPAVDKEGTQEVAKDDATDLLMSPNAAVSALSDRLTKEDSSFKDSFKDSIYITSVFDLQKKVVADAKDASYVFSHTASTESIVSLRTSDGGAMVVVRYTFGIDATSKAEAKLTVGPDAAVFTGGTETTTGFTLNYAEPVVMYIPPAGADTAITLLSAQRDLVGGTFK